MRYNRNFFFICINALSLWSTLAGKVHAADICTETLENVVLAKEGIITFINKDLEEGNRSSLHVSAGVPLRKITGDHHEAYKAASNLLDLGKQDCRCAQGNPVGNSYGIIRYIEALKNFMVFAQDGEDFETDERLALATLAVRYATDAYNACYMILRKEDPATGELRAVIDHVQAFNLYLKTSTLAGQMESKYRESLERIATDFKYLRKAESVVVIQQPSGPEPWTAAWLRHIMTDYVKQEIGNIVTLIFVIICLRSPLSIFAFHIMCGYASQKPGFDEDALKHYRAASEIMDTPPSRWRFISYWFFKHFSGRAKVYYRLGLIYSHRASVDTQKAFDYLEKAKRIRPVLTRRMQVDPRLEILRKADQKRYEQLIE